MSGCCVISLAARSDSSDQAAATLHIQQLHGTIQLHPRTAACTVDVRIEAEAEARSSDSVQAAAGCIRRAASGAVVEEEFWRMDPAKLYAVFEHKLDIAQQVIDVQGAQLRKERHGGARKRTWAAIFAASAAGMDLSASSGDE